MQIKEKNNQDDFVEAINHVLTCIDKKGLENCSHDTQVAHERLLDLSQKLNDEYVLYRP